MHQGNARVHVSGHAKAELAIATGVPRDRVVIAEDGVVVTGPEVHARGLPEGAAVLEDVKPLIAAALAEAGQQGVGDVYALQQVVRRVVGRWASRTLRRRRMIIPVVVEA